MAEILKEQNFVSGEIAFGYGVEMAVDFQFVPGEEYTICFDGSEYTCTALDASGLVPGYVVVGNASEYDFPSNNEPFGIVGDSTAGVIAVVCRNDSAPAEHSVSISTAEDNDYLIKGSTLKGIANAIRSKSGTTGDIAVTDMAAKISEITGGGSGGSDDVRYVTFMSHDGAVEYGKIPVAVGYDCPNPKFDTPTRESTAQYDYTFAGWSTSKYGGYNPYALGSVTENRTVYAAFDVSTRHYTINYYDGDTLLKSESLAYGSTPNYVPTKDGFEFTEWEPAVANVTANASYYAQWEAADTVLYSGTCGDNATWQITLGGKLIIAGTGATYDYAQYASGGERMPWEPYRTKNVTSIIVKNGITRLGTYLFFYHSKVTSISIAESVTTIGKHAFDTCNTITEIAVPATVRLLEPGAFNGCSALSRLVFEDTEGWCAASSAEGAGSTPLDVSDPAKNASGAKSNFSAIGYQYLINT